MNATVTVPEIPDTQRVLVHVFANPGQPGRDIGKALGLTSDRVAKVMHGLLNSRTKPLVRREKMRADQFGRSVYAYYPVKGAKLPFEAEAPAAPAPAAEVPAPAVVAAKPRVKPHDPTHDIPFDELSDVSKVLKWTLADARPEGVRTSDVAKATGIITSTVAAALLDATKRYTGKRAIVRREEDGQVNGKMSYRWFVLPDAQLPPLTRARKRKAAAEPVASPAAAVPSAPSELPTEHITIERPAAPVAVEAAPPAPALAPASAPAPSLNIIVESVSSLFANLLIDVARQTIQKFEEGMRQFQAPAPQLSFEIEREPSAGKQKLPRVVVYGLRKDVSDRVEAQLSDFFDIKSCRDETPDRLRQAVEWVGSDGVVCMMVDYISHSDVAIIKNYAKTRGRKVLHVGGTESGLVRLLEERYLNSMH